MKVGDRITGNAALNATTVTVVSLDSTNVFTMSQAVALADGLSLRFSNQMNYQWPVDDTSNIEEGMIVVPGTDIVADSKIAEYEDKIVFNENTVREKEIINYKTKAVDNLNNKPVIVRGEVSTQAGNIVFDKQQPLSIAGTTLKIGGYGLDKVTKTYGTELEFSNLKIELTPVTTTTTSGVSNSTSVPVASRNGILDSVSKVSGIGIDSSTAIPTVSSGAGAVSGAGTIVLSAAQTLENGVTLTFTEAGSQATIRDCMNKRKKNQIDILESIGTSQYKYDNIEIFYLNDLDS